MRNSLTMREAGKAVAKRLALLCGVLTMVGCAMFATGNWDQVFGPAEPRDRIEIADSDAGGVFLNQVQPLLERRCVVCHGCYDSPCQLNLASPEGVDRGASKDEVYSGSRLSSAPLTRLFEDAQSTGQWRDMGFYPVLNEHEQTPRANLQASVMYQMLELKRENPLPQQAILSDSFDLSLDRKQECPKPQEIDKFIDKHPLWGMPYGLPGLSDSDFNTLEEWLEQGARMALPPMYAAATHAEVDRWEQFLNGDSLKQQLISRYLFEHWFLAHLHFSELGDGEFFKLVRSSTPPGEPIELLATRRPYDDPGVDRVYYRFWRDHSTILDKTHMPYALDGKRMAWLKSLFLEPEYQVEALPSYAPELAANPFITFNLIPVNSRWVFLRAEGQFTIMNFIKGPVCRGQTALSVIRDNFWVVFESDGFIEQYPEEATAFLSSQEVNLGMPGGAGSDARRMVSTWKKYSKLEHAYLTAKSDIMSEFYAGGQMNLDLIWDGDGDNQNAALTVFRHFSSASIVKGLIGPEPKTAWLIDYPILERIHYLLVAGFDVFGNVNHQLTTRLYMDFLRMEGEFNFLSLLPPETRHAESREWYKGASEKQQSYVYGSRANFESPPDISYQTDDPKRELFGMLQQRLAPVLNHSYDLDQPTVPASQREALQRLQALQGLAVAPLPQVVFLNVQSSDGADYYYTLLHNSAHSNITSLFKESSNLVPEEDTLTVVKGFIGSYPEAYWRVQEADLVSLVEQVAGLTDEASYAALMDRYGIRRTAPEFWQHSDKMISAHHREAPLENALLDYNRLENR
jgi:hypothetical protein